MNWFSNLVVAYHLVFNLERDGSSHFSHFTKCCVRNLIFNIFTLEIFQSNFTWTKTLFEPWYLALSDIRNSWAWKPSSNRCSRFHLHHIFLKLLPKSSICLFLWFINNNSNSTGFILIIYVMWVINAKWLIVFRFCATCARRSFRSKVGTFRVLPIHLVASFVLKKKIAILKRLK